MRLRRALIKVLALDYRICPTCGLECATSCRCRIGDKRCPNGHDWHYCPSHGTLHLWPGHDQLHQDNGNWCTCQEDPPIPRGEGHERKDYWVNSYPGGHGHHQSWTPFGHVQKVLALPAPWDTVYHGTPAKYGHVEMKPGDGFLDEGYYFTNNLKRAWYYAGEEGHVYRYKLKMNPEEIAEEDGYLTDRLMKKFDYHERDAFNKDMRQAGGFNQWLKNHGFKAIRHGNEICVFDKKDAIRQGQAKGDD